METLNFILAILAILIFVYLIYIRYKFLNYIRRSKEENKDFYIWFPFAYVIYYFKNIK